MPSLEEWTGALLTEQRVHVESTAALCAAISARQASRQQSLAEKGADPVAFKDHLIPIEELAGVQSVTFRPLELLHAMGRITTPPVENLADISATWAILRYLWAFAIPPAGGLADLHLSEHAQKIDFHQKGLLSDEVGVAMAQWLMENHLDAPYPTDVSLARDDEDTWGEIETTGPLPDYLFHNQDRTRIYVVECKGSQSGRPQCEEQLRRGTEQLVALSFLDPAQEPSRGFVFGTYMEKHQTTVLAIDPPGGSSPAGPQRSRWSVRDERAFKETLRRGAEAKLLHFSGFYEEARDLRKLEQLAGELRRRPMQRSVADERTTELGDFRGTASSIRADDGMRLEVFRGMHVARLNEMLELRSPKEDKPKRPQKFKLEQPTNLQNESTGKQARLLVSRETPDQVLGQSFSGVGTLLEIKLIAPAAA